MYIVLPTQDPGSSGNSLSANAWETITVLGPPLAPCFAPDHSVRREPSRRDEVDSECVDAFLVDEVAGSTTFLPVPGLGFKPLDHPPPPQRDRVDLTAASTTPGRREAGASLPRSAAACPYAGSKPALFEWKMFARRCRLAAPSPRALLDDRDRVDHDRHRQRDLQHDQEVAGLVAHERRAKWVRIAWRIPLSYASQIGSRADVRRAPGGIEAADQLGTIASTTARTTMSSPSRPGAAMKSSPVNWFSIPCSPSQVNAMPSSPPASRSCRPRRVLLKQRTPARAERAAQTDLGALPQEFREQQPDRVEQADDEKHISESPSST